MSEIRRQPADRPPVDCQAVQRLLADYCDGELEAAERDRVEEHVVHCRGCGVDLSRVELELLRLREALVPMEPSAGFTRAVMDEVRAMVASEASQAPPRQFTRRVMERVRSEAGLPERRRASSWRWLYAAATAVSVVFAGLAFLLFRYLEPSSEASRADFVLVERGSDLVAAAGKEPHAAQPGQSLSVPASLTWQEEPVSIEAAAQSGEARFQLAFAGPGKVVLLERGTIRLERGSVRVVSNDQAGAAADVAGPRSLRIDLPTGEHVLAGRGELTVRLRETDAGLRGLLDVGTQTVQIEVGSGAATLHLHEDPRPLDLVEGSTAILEPLQPVRVLRPSSRDAAAQRAAKDVTPAPSPADGTELEVTWLGFDALFDTVQVLGKAVVAWSGEGAVRVPGRPELAAALATLPAGSGRARELGRTYGLLLEARGQPPFVVYGLSRADLGRDQIVLRPAPVLVRIPLKERQGSIRVETTPRGMLGHHWRQVNTHEQSGGSLELAMLPGTEVRWWELAASDPTAGYAYALPADDPRSGQGSRGRIVLGPDEIRNLPPDAAQRPQWAPGSLVAHDRDSSRPDSPSAAEVADLRVFLNEGERPVSAGRIYLRTPGQGPWLAADSTPKGVAFLAALPVGQPVDVLAIAEESGRLLVAWQRCEPRVGFDLRLQAAPSQALRGWVGLPQAAHEAIDAVLSDGPFAGRQTAAIVAPNGSFALPELPAGRLRLRLAGRECEAGSDGVVPPLEAWQPLERR